MGSERLHSIILPSEASNCVQKQGFCHEQALVEGFEHAVVTLPTGSARRTGARPPQKLF
jgi:hypothetical protein